MDYNTHLVDGESGDPIVVTMDEICDLFGGCAECPGWGLAENLRLHSKTRDFQSELPGKRIVICTHWCHAHATIV
jgi:hypothetical protein